MKNVKKIPKIIHYCWFGNTEIPVKYKEYIDSWKKYNPDYEIKEWNEKNYDVNKNEYTRLAYKDKKFAFLTDYVRLDVIYNYGGIYLDTDVEVLKSFDDLLDNDAFMGLEYGNFVATGLGFGAIKEHPFIKLNKDVYENFKLYKENGEFNQINCPRITTELFIKNGAKLEGNIETVFNVKLFPPQYFCPMNYFTGDLNIVDETYSIHWYSSSWFSDKERKWLKIERRLRKKYGEKINKNILYRFFKNYYCYGIIETSKKAIKKWRKKC